MTNKKTEIIYNIHIYSIFLNKEENYMKMNKNYLFCFILYLYIEALESGLFDVIKIRLNRREGRINDKGNP